jgi:hypothetical protein
MVATWSTQASFVIATTIPIRTKTMIAICIQIQVGDIALEILLGQSGSALRGGP